MGPFASDSIANLNSDQLRMLLARRQHIEKQQHLLANLDSQQLQQMLTHRLQIEAQGTVAPPPLMPTGVQPGLTATHPAAGKEPIGVPPAPFASPQVQSFTPMSGPPHTGLGLQAVSTCTGLQGATSWAGLSTVPKQRMPGMPPAAQVQGPRASQRQVPEDTSRISRGTVGHPHICKLACKFFGTARGCKDGVECPHCHMCPWKRRYRTARGKAEALNAKKK